MKRAWIILLLVILILALSGCTSSDGKADTIPLTAAVASMDNHVIACGYNHTVTLKSDGTVVAVGNNDDGQCDVGMKEFSDIRMPAQMLRK